MEDFDRKQASKGSCVAAREGYERPEIFELGNVEDLTFGPGGDLKDGKTLAHNPEPTPADFDDDD